MHCDRLYLGSLLIFLLCIFLSPSPFINLSIFSCGKSKLATFYDLWILRYCHNKDYVKMVPHKLSMDLLTSIYRVSWLVLFYRDSHSYFWWNQSLLINRNDQVWQHKVSTYQKVCCKFRIFVLLSVLLISLTFLLLSCLIKLHSSIKICKKILIMGQLY